MTPLLESAKDFLSYYANEVVQAVVALTIYKFIVTKKITDIDFHYIAKGGLIVGLITAILEFYDPSFNKNIKSGVMASIGGNIVKNIK